MNREALLLVDPISIIESHTLSFWQKYVLGINMSYIDCDESQPNCTLPRKGNSLYMMVHKNNVSSRNNFEIVTNFLF